MYFNFNVSHQHYVLKMIINLIFKFCDSIVILLYNLTEVRNK